MIVTRAAGRAADLLQFLSGPALAHVAEAPGGRRRPRNSDAGQQTVKDREATHAGVTPRAPVAAAAAGSAHE